jgi:hypothetical protein
MTEPYWLFFGHTDFLLALLHKNLACLASEACKEYMSGCMVVKYWAALCDVLVCKHDHAMILAVFEHMSFVFELWCVTVQVGWLQSSAYFHPRTWPKHQLSS